jgi:cysteine-rich CPXCG protein
MSEPRMQEEFVISCPYCGEDVEVHIEADVAGSLVQDCEVCCNPWLLSVTVDNGNRSVSVARADGSN